MRKEEGGCRSLFQGIANVNRTESCPFCKTVMSRRFGDDLPLHPMPLCRGWLDMMGEKVGLKPCPFCGESVKLDREPHGGVNIHCKNRHYFQCADEFYFAYGMDEKDKVIKEWNNRVEIKCRTCRHLQVDDFGTDYECNVRGCVNHSKWERRYDDGQ